MKKLIKEFRLRTVKRNKKLYINFNDIKSKIHIPDLSKLITNKYIIYEKTNDAEGIKKQTIEMFIVSILVMLLNI